MTALLLAHAVSTWMMTAIIWFVQLVHYPLFLHVGEQAFTTYESVHVRRITWIVAPLMLLEALTSVLLLVTVEGSSRAVAWIGAGLLAIIWGSTAMIQVPCHQQLEKGYQRETIVRLVTTNWIRTAAWSLRGVIAGLLLLNIEIPS